MLNALFAQVILAAAEEEPEGIDLLRGIDGGSHRVSRAIREIEKSLRPWYWDDDHHLDTKKGHKVFNAERKAAKELKDLLDRDDDSDSDSSDSSDDSSDDSSHRDGTLSPEEAATVVRVIDKLLLADDQLAQTALDEAIAAADGVDCRRAQRQIAKAESALARARARAAAGDCEKAIKEYRKAWQYAQKALKYVSRCTR